ncbi:MAG: hypothetical protein AAFP97_13550 [Pseudomonadota bacterium]
MADAVKIELNNDGLAPHLTDLHARISSGAISDLTIDLSAARNFGASDLQALIHLDRAATAASITIHTTGASDTQATILASRPSSSSASNLAELT